MSSRTTPSFRRARAIRNRFFIASLVLFVMIATVCVPVVSLNIVGIRTLYVVSESMEPSISKGDLVLASENYGGLTEGDVVVYKARWFNDESVLHRIVSSKTNKDGNKIYRTKGDNNPINDPGEITTEEIKSEVVAVVPYGGYIWNWWTLGVLSVLYLGATVLSTDRAMYACERRIRKRMLSRN